MPGYLAPIELKNPLEGQFRGFCEANREAGTPTMLRMESAVGKTLAICGAGPSLAKYPVEGVDTVWACNSAVTYLLNSGVHVDAAVGIDQTAGLLKEWQQTFPVDYYLASSCHPDLVQHVIHTGRSVSWFHNAVGFPDEQEYYKRYWPTPAFMMGHGATVVPRAIGLAIWMGFERIDVYGADCCLGPDDVAHADGTSAKDAYPDCFISHGVTNGRVYRSRPDMLMSAVDLARFAQHSRGRVRLVGDTLAVALQGKPDDYLDLVMRRIKPDEEAPLPQLVELVPVET